MEASSVVGEMISQEGAENAVAWSCHGKGYLDSYLIQEVEHPALNAQSLFIRAFVCDRLSPGAFSELVEEELYFSACASFALLGQREGWFRELYETMLEARHDGALPEFLRRAYREAHGPRFDLKILFDDLAKCLTLGFEHFESPFMEVWTKRLPALRNGECKGRYLELACGSANDYRFFDQYGVAAAMDYEGVDLCPENIANAKARYPNVSFREDDASSLDSDDDEFDVVMAFDLFEHLPPNGLEKALSEAVRVCRDELWLSFFNLTDCVEHQFKQERGNYYWNQLSISQVAESLTNSGCKRVDVIDISRELEDRFPGYRHYNQEAQILIARVSD